MKKHPQMREQVARNLKTVMDMAGVENPNQFEALTDKFSVQQIRNILNCSSGASVDALAYISEVLNNWPPFLVASEEVRRAIVESGATHKEITDVIYALCGTTPEGRKMIADIAAMVPKRPLSEIDQ